MEKLYTCQQVAERYKVKVSTVWEWIRLLKLSAVKVGHLYRIRESDLMSFEKRNITKK